MKKSVKPCKCGSIEFVTEPNQYDVYQIIDGKLELTETLFTECEIDLFCRECGELINSR